MPSFFKGSSEAWPDGYPDGRERVCDWASVRSVVVLFVGEGPLLRAG